MENQYDRDAYRVDPKFDRKAHQRRYPLRWEDIPRVTEPEVEAANDDAIPEAA